MEQLTDLEYAIMEKMCTQYPIIREHLPYIEVVSREKTGVGVYVNFKYKKTNEIRKIKPLSMAFSQDVPINIDSLKFGLAYEVAVSKGLLMHIELVAYCEQWDGKYKNFSFTESSKN